MAGSQADAGAYGALVEMFALFGLTPVAAGISMIAIIALMVCAVRYSPLRYGVVLLAIAAWAGHGILGNMSRCQNWATC